ncbi:MAG: hypothetical protein AB7L92_06970 [Alphaproteobacteria bacterium]
MKLHLTLGLLALMTFAADASARPISYPGGWMLMQMNDGNMHSLEVDYSPTANYSVGYVAEYWRENDWQLHAVSLNNLIKRWNLPSSQANLYLKSAAGVAYSDFGAFDGKTEPAAFTGISADWEDRRFFTMYENHLVYAGDIDKFFMQKARVGIAPYIGDYGDLHTWLMLQVEHNPEKADHFTVTPLVRLFKGETLVEAGVSEDGDVLFNFTMIF